MFSTPLTACLSFVVAATRDEEEFVNELRHLPEGWPAVGGVLLTVGICWLVAWMYRTEGRLGASTRVRALLGVLRCMVLLILIVILLEPVRVRILRRWIDSYTVVLLDTSSSMDLTDTYRDPAAAQRVKTVLGGELRPVRRSDLVSLVLEHDGRSFFRELTEDNRTKVYTFSDEPQLLGTLRAAREKPTTDAAPDAAPKAARRDGKGSGQTSLLGVDRITTDLTATGPATNIERALRRSVESLGSSPIAAVVVFSDGGFNQGASSEETARYARERRLPIHVVGVGDPSSPRNVRVVEIMAPPNAFQKDPFSITARLSTEGLSGQSLTVQLRERVASASGAGTLVASKTVLVPAGGSIEPVTFERRRDRTGRVVYTVLVPPLEGESVTDDNAKQTTVNVIDSRTRVLVLSGGPSWEYRFVTRLLERDDTFDVSCWLQSADLSAVRDGNTVIDHLPATAKELYQYDVILLMDPDPAELGEPWCRLVDTLVTEYGGGLLLSAARAFTPALMRDRALKPLIDLLPVTPDPQADLLLNELGHYQLSGSPPVIDSTAAGHPILRLADDPVSTRLAWQDFAGVYWHYPVLREKPVATVLLRHSNPRMRNKHGAHVLAAVQYVGAGRTGFLGFDSTWRWRRHSVERFDRFWVQLVRYLAEGKLLGGAKRGMLLTENDQYSLGEAVTVTARLFDSQYKPLRRDQVTARYVVDSERGEFVLGGRADRPGWFEGRFVPDRIGRYRISLEMVHAAGEDPLEISREIGVGRPNIEILRPQMARGELMTLAEQSHGGRYFELDQAGEIPDLIEDLHEEIPVRSRPTTLWDNWIMLTVLLTLLTLEWGIRKWNRLL